MAFTDEERRVRARDYWVLRGTMSTGDETVEIAWSDVAVATDSGPIEPRLVVAPTQFAFGPPPVPGAMPERVAIGLQVINADGALDPYLVGGPTPQTEYTGPSLYNLRARLFQGYIADDGTITEEPWTPWLVLAGPWEHRDGIVSLQLASQDERFFGRSKRVCTVARVRDAALVPGSFSPPPDDGWASVVASTNRNEEAIVPWAYGRALVPLIRVSAEDDNAQWFYACMTSEMPSLLDWDVYGERDGAVELITDALRREGAGVALWRAQLEIEDDEGVAFQAWLVGAQAPASEPASEWTRYWIVPRADNLLGAGPDAPMTSLDVLAALMADHAEAGAAFDSASFDRANAALAYTSGAVGGIFGADGSTIGDVVPYITQPVGLAIWIGPDDLIHVMMPGSWSPDDVIAVRGTLPSLHDGDVYPSGPDGSTWTEHGPADPEDWGAPITAITINWEADQLTVFPPDLVPPGMSGTRMSAAKRIQILTEAELRWNGAWVHPPDAIALLDGLTSARQFATRLVTCTTHPWVARLGPGALLRARTRQGIRYDGRALRLLRATVMPAERAAECVFEDAGALELMRVGRLDSELNHILFMPSSSQSITFTNGSDLVDLSAGVAQSSWVGASLWTFGASSADLRRSWRIVQLVSAARIRVDAVAPVGASLSGPPPGTDPHRANWVVMRNWVHNPNYRADYIRDCDEVAQTFSNDDPGFQYSG